MTDARARGAKLMCAALLLFSGCAPPPGSPSGAAVPPAAHAPAPPRPTPRREPAPMAGVRDSTPSADAQRVLATIPEPLSPSQQVPPPPGTGRTITMPAPAAASDTLRAGGMVTMRAPDAAFDTLRAERPAENDSAAIPVPSPTLPLGNDSAGTLHMPDTLTAPPPTTPATTPPPTTVEPAKPSAPASDKPPAGECWRLQVAAPLEKAKAESRRAAAQSLLLVPMVIELEKGLYKVRTHDCMTNDAAESLKKRAEDSGFAGSFVLNAAAATPAASPKPKPHAAPAKHSVAKKKKKHR